MIGRSVINCLGQRNADVFGVFHESYDLLNDFDIKKAFVWAMPEYVIHAAGFNREYWV